MDWTEAELRTVIRLNKQKKSLVEIAATLLAEHGTRRTAKAIQHKRFDLRRYGEQIAGESCQEPSQEAPPTLVDDALQKENAKLKHQLSLMQRSRVTQPMETDGDVFRFGSLSDTHKGSLYANTGLLKYAYEQFEREGVSVVYHSGDMLDGEKMYGGHEYELSVPGADAQVADCAESYPYVKGIQTKFIDGNHDGSFWKRSGFRTGEKIAEAREDLECVGQGESDVEVQTLKGSIIIRLSHPGKGTAYAISYQPQKYIESLTGGHKPNVVLIGHYHKAEYLFYRNIHAFQCGTVQHQTPFMRERNIAAMQGFWIIELTVGKRGIVSCKSEFYPCYD